MVGLGLHAAYDDNSLKLNYARNDLSIVRMWQKHLQPIQTAVVNLPDKYAQS